MILSGKAFILGCILRHWLMKTYQVQIDVVFLSNLRTAVAREARFKRGSCECHYIAGEHRLIKPKIACRGKPRLSLRAVGSKAQYIGQIQIQGKGESRKHRANEKRFIINE